MRNRPVKLRFKYHQDGLDAHFARNGRFYGICRIKKCTPPSTHWYIEMLIPGGLDHTYDQNPVPTLRDAKANARVIAERVIADFQGITLLPPKPGTEGVSHKERGYGIKKTSQ